MDVAQIGDTAIDQKIDQAVAPLRQELAELRKRADEQAAELAALREQVGAAAGESPAGQ